MLVGFEQFLAAVVQTAQNIWTGISDILSRGLQALYEFQGLLENAAPRLANGSPIAELMVLAGIIMIIFGLIKRLEYRGVFFYMAGISLIVFGLVNLTNPFALPPNLRV